MSENDDLEFYEQTGTETVANSDEIVSNTAPNIEVTSGHSGEGLKFKDMSRWGVIEGDTYYGVSASSDKIRGGVYTCHHTHELGYNVRRKINNTDSLLVLPDNAAKNVIEEIDQFSTLKPDFERLNLMYKRGILLWGPPGSGKTTTIQLMMKQIIDEMDGVAIYIDDPNVGAECLQLVRRIEPDRQLLVLLEDIDALVHRFGEAGFLSLLDGEHQIDNVVYIGTTNYPKRLDKRFTNRPSRFDTVKKIGMPTASARRAYLEHRDPSFTEAELDDYVAQSKGFSVAHLRELVVSCRVFKKPVDKTVKRLNLMQQQDGLVDIDEAETKQVGFTLDVDDTLEEEKVDSGNSQG